MIRLDLTDLQGNIHRPYGRFNFPLSRHLFFRLDDPLCGRRFVQGLRGWVSSAEPWIEPPPVALNLGFTYAGLRALDLPTRTLRLLPDEFIDGMHCRSEILGDVGESGPEHWDPVWREAQAAHIWVGLFGGCDGVGAPLPALGKRTDEIIALARSCGVTLLEGHGADGRQQWQDCQSLMATRADGSQAPCAREHFGYTDAIADPVFRGQFEPEDEALAVIGGGKIGEGDYNEATSWSPLETGEFILGYVDEGQEFPIVTQPFEFTRNGSFMVWRKLHQDVAAFDAYIAGQAELYMRVTGVTDRTEAEETLRAKMIGRWPSGVPLLAAPTWAEHQALMAEWGDCIELTLREPRDSAEQQRLAAFAKLLNAFRYGDDLDGAKCPFGAHIRRANPRDMLDPLLSATQGSTALTNRRRLLRRGMAYRDPNGDCGLVFMAICASLFRQFEFVQQQWMNYGLDLEAGNDTCPVVGLRTAEHHKVQSDKFVIPSASPDEAPFIAANLPQFVSTRGGDYFFLPSLSAIRMIAMGTVDPT